MFFKKILSLGKPENRVLEMIREHVDILCNACWLFKTALEKRDTDLFRSVADREREGDRIRRSIIEAIYEGAFLPYIRPDLCKFVETLDQIFDKLQDAAFDGLEVDIPESIETESIRVTHMNARMCEILKIMLVRLSKEDDLREKALAIRIYEKKIDDMKFSLLRDMRRIPVEDFWQGRILAEFIENLTGISNTIEDASDLLQIVNLSLRS